MTSRYRNQTNDLLERMAAVLENMQQNQQQPQPANPPPAGAVAAEAKTLSDFRSCNPTKFAGGFKPEEANKWILEMDKIFRTLECPDAQRIAYAVFMLEGEAEHWWRHTA